MTVTPLPRTLDEQYARMPEELREVASRIVDYLSRHPPSDRDVIAKALKIDGFAVSQALDWLEPEFFECLILYRPNAHLRGIVATQRRHAEANHGQ